MTAIATPLRGYTTSAPCGGTFSSRRRLGDALSGANRRFAPPLPKGEARGAAIS